MNRAEFMSQLERLLQSIAPAEREEALQYYSDYFDDAGVENEQDVIEALGNPARVAENIKRDLLENEGHKSRAKASDRAIVEYGQVEVDGAGDEANGNWADIGCQVTGNQTSDSQGRNNQAAGSQHNNGWSMGNQAASAQAAGGWNGGSQGAGGQPTGDASKENTGQPPKSSGMPVWVIVLLILLFPIWLPLLMGVFGALFGVLVSWFAIIFGFGVTAVILLAVLVLLVVVGIECLFVNPWVGLALTGGGLLCGGIGILFLMLVVAMAGIVTPAVFRGIASLFRRKII